jgi:hypothetical protein
MKEKKTDLRASRRIDYIQIICSKKIIFSKNKNKLQIYYIIFVKF